MTVDQKLSAIRDVIQVDIGKRGLARSRVQSVQRIPRRLCKCLPKHR